MAQKEDIRSRIRAINPQALDLIDEIDRLLPGDGINITVTEDMLSEEVEMAVLEAFLKIGNSPAEAEINTKDYLDKIKRMEEKLEAL